MRRLVFTVVILCSGYAYGVDYSMDCTETGLVYGPKGTLMDNSARSVRTSLSVNRSDRVTVEFRPMQLQLKNGTSYLKMPAEMLGVFSPEKRAPEAPSRLHIVASEPKSLEWVCLDYVLKGSSYEDLLERTRVLLELGLLKHATILPLALVAEKIPFVWGVDENIKPGDEVEIPFRRALDPSHLSSADRAASLICVEKNGDTVVLESNFQRNTDSTLLTWHVQVVFDMQKQLPTSIVENRFTRIVADENVHLMRESLRCRLKEE